MMKQYVWENITTLELLSIDLISWNFEINNSIQFTKQSSFFIFTEMNRYSKWMRLKWFQNSFCFQVTKNIACTTSAPYKTLKRLKMFNHFQKVLVIISLCLEPLNWKSQDVIVLFAIRNSGSWLCSKSKRNSIDRIVWHSVLNIE